MLNRCRSKSYRWKPSAQTLQGDKKAVMHEKPAPMPTKRPDIVPDAQNDR